MNDKITIGVEVLNTLTNKSGIVTGFAEYEKRARQLLVCYEDKKDELWDEESIFEKKQND